MLGHPPDDGALCLVGMGEGDAAMDMDHLIVPGRHMPVMLRFGGIPVRRDVTVLTTENQQDRRAIIDDPVQIIGCGHMTDHCLRPISNHRDMIGHNTGVCRHHQCGQRRGFDDVLHGLRIHLFKMRWQIHLC